MENDKRNEVLISLQIELIKTLMKLVVDYRKHAEKNDLDLSDLTVNLGSATASILYELIREINQPLGAITKEQTEYLNFCLSAYVEGFNKKIEILSDKEKLKDPEIINLVVSNSYEITEVKTAKENKMNTEVVDQECYGACTFMNLCGDITLTWDEHNKEQILEMVRKKMKEGYVFFTTKKIAFNRLKRKVKITEKNIDVTEEIIVTDEQFEKMIADMDDKDIATLVRDEKATLVKRKDRSEILTMKKATKAEDVIDKNSIAIRPVVGG